MTDSSSTPPAPPSSGQGDRGPRPPGSGGGNRSRHRRHRGRNHRPQGLGGAPGEGNAQQGQGPRPPRDPNRPSQPQNQQHHRGPRNDQRYERPQGGQNQNPNLRQDRPFRDNRPRNPDESRSQNHPNQNRFRNDPNGPRRPQQNRPGPQQQNQQRHNGNNRGLTIQAIQKKYDVLYEQHNLARKKFYEFYYRANPKQLAKLERLFYESIEILRKFERNLRPWQKDILAKRFKEYPSDITYSQNHEIPLDKSFQEIPDPFQHTVDQSLENENPHVLQTQQQRPSFKEDTEESVGSFEDYQKLKGLA